MSYPAGSGGTDFTPTTGILGFVVYDAGVAVAATSGARQSATVIRVTHASVSGARTVSYNPSRTAFTSPNATRANLVRDNFSIGFALKAMLTPITAV